MIVTKTPVGNPLTTAFQGVFVIIASMIAKPRPTSPVLDFLTTEITMVRIKNIRVIREMVPMDIF